MAKTVRSVFLFIIGIYILVLFFVPMRSGNEDVLKANTEEIALAPGDSYTVEYTLVSEKEQNVVYASENTAVAVVDQKGVVTAVAPGNTMIRLTAQYGARITIPVTVNGVPIRSFQLTEHNIDMNKGDIRGISYRFNDGATVQSISWTSDDPGIAAVDSLGRIRAVSGGCTVVHAQVAGGYRDSVTINVSVKTRAVQINPGEMKVGAGTYYPLSVAYFPSDSTDSPDTWKSSDTRVVTVDDKGMMRAVMPGSALITVVTQQGIAGSTRITVEQPVMEFQLNPSSVVVERGDEIDLETWYIGENGQLEPDVSHFIEWSSSDPECAAVNKGRVSALASGTAYITAVSDNHEARCAVQVITSVQDVKLEVMEIYMLREQTAAPYQIKASIEPEDADDPTLDYSTDNALVATVDANGLVTMTGGYGTAVIHVAAASGAEAEFRVHVVTQLPSA